VLGRNAEGDVRQQPHQADDAMTPPDGLDGVFGQLDQLASVSILELVREC
jgi:hypothetical protein